MEIEETFEERQERLRVERIKNLAKARANLDPTAPRPGARKRVKYEEIVDATKDELMVLLKLVPQALQDLILGVWVESADGRRVYRKAPNTDALKILLERTVGKQPLAVEHTGVVQHAHKDYSDFEDHELEKLVAMAKRGKARKLGGKDDGADSV